MKQLIIIGASGFGREVCNNAKNCYGYGDEWLVKGFLDDNLSALDGFDGDYASIFSTITEYEPQANDVFVCALGNPKPRRKCSEIILNRGGEFISLIDKRAMIAPTAKIGNGAIILPYAFVSVNTRIGVSAIIHPFCNLGHDVKVGDYCSIESHSFMGGFSQIGNDVQLHTRATLLPSAKVEDGATVGAGSVVIRKVKAGTTVFGVPAKKIEY